MKSLGMFAVLGAVIIGALYFFTRGTRPILNTGAAAIPAVAANAPGTVNSGATPAAQLVLSGGTANPTAQTITAVGGTVIGLLAALGIGGDD